MGVTIVSILGGVALLAAIILFFERKTKGRKDETNNRHS